eukprot:scaffold967_cov26-Cyclotella_meneghiniana.AAC.3
MAPLRPDGHALGYNENDADYIVNDVFTMKGVTKSIRMGTFCEHIHLNLGATTIENFYQGYLPHYREFADALIEYRHAIEYMESDDAFYNFWGDEYPDLPLIVCHSGQTATHFSVFEIDRENDFGTE